MNYQDARNATPPAIVQIAYRHLTPHQQNLIFYIWQHSEYGCLISNASLAKQIKRSPRTVTRYLRRLRYFDLIRFESRANNLRVILPQTWPSLERWENRLNYR